MLMLLLLNTFSYVQAEQMPVCTGAFCTQDMEIGDEVDFEGELSAGESMVGNFAGVEGGSAKVMLDTDCDGLSAWAMTASAFSDLSDGVCTYDATSATLENCDVLVGPVVPDENFYLSLSAPTTSEPLVMVIFNPGQSACALQNGLWVSSKPLGSSGEEEEGGMKWYVVSSIGFGIMFLALAIMVIGFRKWASKGPSLSEMEARTAANGMIGV